MFKRFICILVSLFLLFSLVGCGGEKFTPAQKKFDSDVKATAPSSDEVIAQNDKYSLEYVAETGSVRLVEIATGTKWEMCPTPEGEPELDEYGLPVLRHGFPQSALEVGYMDRNIDGGGNGLITTYDGVLDYGRMVYKPIENGVTIEYYFDGEKFMIPVNYVLCDDYLSISIDTTKIQEEDKKITYISIAPFLCSVPNDAEDSYLFIPSGSGALIDNKSISAQGISYSAYVYGEDLSMEKKYDATNETAIRLPVYGYKNGNRGGLSVIDGAADTVLLTSTSGHTKYTYSAIYPAFQLRSYSYHLAKSFSKEYYTNIYPENMIEANLSIRFYPLSDENANYSGMADKYRDYLIKEKGLTENTNEKAVSLNIVGGTQITKSFLGVPYKTLFAATSVKEAGNIVSEVSETVDSVAVKLLGFGASGVDVGKVGGGFKLGENFGSTSQLKSLAASCVDKNVDLYMDYDLVKFNSAGEGFSFFSDVAMNAGYIRADQFIINKATRYTNDKLKYRLLRPIKFDEAVSKALKQNASWQMSGVSLQTLSSLSYSDYSDYTSTVDYNSKNGFEATTQKALSQIEKNNQKFMADSANIYAALAADIITDTPISSDKGHAFFEDVPFYSMVFKGYIPMTTESINMATSEKKAILGAVESGIGLNYTVISNWENSLIDANTRYFYSTLYSSVKNDLFETYNELSGYYDSIKGAKIVSNNVVVPGVHCTVFDNGVTVYVNYNSTSAQTPAGELAAFDYIILGGAA